MNLDKVKLDISEALLDAVYQEDHGARLSAMRPSLLASGEMRDILDVLAWDEWAARKVARKQGGN